MKKLIDYKVSLVLVLVVVAIVLGGGSAKADFTFGEPTHLEAPINTSYFDYDACLSTDGLSLFFGSRRPGGSGDTDIWLATRPTKNDPWDTPVNLGPKVNSPYHDTDPSLSADGLSVYFCSNRPV